MRGFTLAETVLVGGYGLKNIHRSTRSTQEFLLGHCTVAMIYVIHWSGFNAVSVSHFTIYSSCLCVHGCGDIDVPLCVCVPHCQVLTMTCLNGQNTPHIQCEEKLSCCLHLSACRNSHSACCHQLRQLKPFLP